MTCIAMGDAKGHGCFMTILTTKRLVLRRAKDTDLPAIFAIMSDPRAMKYWSTSPHQTPEQTRVWLASMIDSPDDLSEDFVIVYNQQVIGKLGFYRLPDVGYILHPDHWGKGIASEAMAAVLHHVFTARNVEVVRADVDPNNEASLKLLRRFGFQQTGTEERTFCVAGVWADSVYLELTRQVFLTAHCVSASVDSP
jgi:[ribosomal protein S5]-alanine N-acetyltransferase